MTKQEVENLKQEYAQCRKNIRNAITENQKAMVAFRNNKNAETSARYEQTKKNHKAAIKEIQEVRNNYYQAVFQLQQETEEV